ncbi:glycosyltransferase [Limimaricola pyoseonensis]|uniref:Dolichol-phosphate mannosyltransferase n=1 Tax=Limimaricola pyoseonensis TaxID=521013 RepID=A0A1G7J270_9RHOB|nr:glycosyltransferase family 2 protein [Limimaricola pyoseonensis]SDF18991.1 dolichol-phosphate mannosyltransferase [Limimaricola pyoseonensis]
MRQERDERPEGIGLSVVVPTFNERDNVAEIVRRLDTALAGFGWEVIFVDDASPDGTAEAVRALARRDRRVRLICRHDRRGLSSAVVEGGLAAAGEIIAVIDGDLQHDESVLPGMVRRIEAGAADLVSASRFLDETGTAAEGLASARRLKISNGGIGLANRLLGLELTDPLTGFFVMRRSLLLSALPHLSQLGFKILLDLVTAAPEPPRLMEVPFRFRPRAHGDSKLDNRVLWDFALFLIEKRIGRYVPLPARFLSFAMINAVGILVHLAVLMPLLALGGTGFAAAQLGATLVAMFFNFSVNNALTYRDRQLTGGAFWRGFAAFALLCSVGVLANVSVASMMHAQFADLQLSLVSVAGALITVVWNFVATQAFIWGRDRRSLRTGLRLAQRRAARAGEATG